MRPHRKIMSRCSEGKPVHVLFTAVEADPLIKVGGLADVAGWLPRALQELPGRKVDIRLVIPYHGIIRNKVKSPQFAASFTVPTPSGGMAAQAYRMDLNGVPTYLIEGEPIPTGMPIYSGDALLDGRKYVFFSLAVLELARALNQAPDILHANDWHTAISVYALGLARGKDPFFSGTRSVLTVHNLPFMGSGTEQAVLEYGLPPASDEQLPEWGRLFPLPLGLVAADTIVAVSPSYAQEILTPDFGCGLQNLLQARAGRIQGILNGLDLDNWNPSSDEALTARFEANNLPKRMENKTALQGGLGLPRHKGVPLLAFIGRMDRQKGVDIALEGLRRLDNQRWQAVFLGTGDPFLEDACRRLEADYPERVRTVTRFDSLLARRLYGGADMLLMPSRYEPCGMAQMIALRYGCLPVARSTGGLKDTICDDPTLKQGTGFLFDEASPEALIGALRRAMAVYRAPAVWRLMQERGMQVDFSWRQSAEKYRDVYCQESRR